MKSVGVVAAAFLFVAASPSLSLCQPSDPKVSLTGTVDYARITEDDGFLGAGFGGAVGLQFRLTDRTSVEVEIGREHHVRDLGRFATAYDPQGRPVPVPLTVRWDGTATFVLGGVSHAFGSARVRPVVWGSGGLMSHGGTTRGPLAAPQVPPGYALQPGDADTGRGRSSTAFTIDGGGGVDVRIVHRVTVRPFAGLRLVNTGNFGPKYIVRMGARIAVGW